MCGDLDKFLDQIDIFWFQKSRTEAIRDRDRNTRYYHLSTIVRRSFNRIEALQDAQGNWFWDDEGIKSMVRDFFLSLFSDDGAPFTPYILPKDCFPTLNAEEQTELDKTFTGCEVKKALFDMDRFKAPGPDGFQALFYQRHWDMVGDHLQHLVLDVLAGQEMPEGFNDTFLALIPKVSNPQAVTQLRPIGLCNVTYKVLSKVLVNRIKLALNKPGRQITDNIIIV